MIRKSLDAATTRIRLWMRNLQAKPNRAPYRRTIRPFLERLEDRCTPSAVSWTGNGNDLNWGDTANWSNNAVPTSSDDVTISVAVSGPINIGASAYSVRSLNDTSAKLSIATGGSLSLVAAPATSTFGQNVTVQSGATLAVGSGASVIIGTGTSLTLTDNGTLTFASGDTVTLNDNGYYVTSQISVGSGGIMTASGPSTTFNATNGNNTNGGNSTSILVNASGELQASNTDFAVGSLNLAIGADVGASDFVGNAFDLSLFLPAIDVQYLTNNLRFRDINLQPDTLTSGENVALNAIGTQTTSNLRYVLPGNFTINTNASLSVGANVPVMIGTGTSLTLTDNGTLSFASGDTVTLNDNGYYVTSQISVGSGGLMTTSGPTTTFNATNGNNTNGGNSTSILVNASGELRASNSTFAVGQLNLAVGADVGASDFVGNAFDLPFYLPAIDVQYLTNNLRFRDIYLQPDTLTSGENVALNAIGTQTTSNLRYVLPGNFTINTNASLSVGANVPVMIGTGTSLTLTDNGTLSFASGDTVTLNDNGYYVTSTISVGSGGLMTTSGPTTTFNATNANNTNGGNSTSILVSASGELRASNSTFAVGQLNLAVGAVFNPSDLVGNAFDLPFYLPAIDVQYLTNNLRFRDINLQPDTLTSGENVALNAIGTQTTINLRYVLPGNFTINTNASLSVGANVPVMIGTGSSSVTLTDNGTLSFGSGDTVTLNDNGYYVTSTISVGSGGLMTTSGPTTTFNATNGNNTNGGNSTSILVSASGELRASNSTFAVGQLNLAVGADVGASDFVGNAFDLPFYLPAIDVQYLTNNLRFRDINLQPDTLTSGENVALDSIGTQTTINLRYVLSGNFTINTNASLSVGSNVPVMIGTGSSSVTLTDNGTLSFASGDTVTLNDNGYYVTSTISVGSGGLMTTSGPTTTFNATNGNNTNGGNSTSILVNASGELQASNSTFAVGQLNLAVGAVFNPSDLVGNAFDLPFYLPAIDVQYLTNNLRFRDINLQPDTLTNGESVALDSIGTQTTTNLRYVFTGNFTIDSGATLSVGPNVRVMIGSGTSLTLTDDGILSFGSGDMVTLNDNGYYVTSQLAVGSGGIMTANGVAFIAVVANGTNGGNATSIVVNGEGDLQVSNSPFAIGSLTLNGYSTDTMSGDVLYGVFTINSAATISIANNDFSNLGNNSAVAVGDPNAHINLENNYWGTTVNSQIAAKILDHNDDASRPYIDYAPDLSSISTNQPPVLATIANQSVNEGSTLTLTASATDTDDDTITYSLDPGAPAGATINATTGVFTYTPPDGPASYTVVVRATDNGSPPLSAVQSFTITVNNVAPTATLSGPTDGFQGVRGQVRTFIVGATDPSAIDQAAGFTYDLHWGDGSPDTIVSGSNGTSVSHVYTVAGNYTVTATATDKDGGVSSAASVSETINIAEVQNGTLMVGGTTGNDTFDLTPSTSNTNDITVSVNSTLIGTFSTNGLVQVLGDGGSGDVLNFDDQANNEADQYLITATSVGRTNAATISWVGIGTLNVKAGTNANTIDVQSTTAATPVHITMGNGGDIINVGDTNNTLDSLLGSLSVTGGTGSTTLNLNDQGSSANQTYTLASTTINRTGAAGITYSKMKYLTVNGSSGTDTYTVVNTSSSTNYTVVGGAGVNTLVGGNAANTWTLTGANAGTVGKVTFSGISNLTGGSSTDTFKFNAAGSLSGTINGGGGSNNSNYSSYGGAVTVNLQTGAATATGGMLNIATVTGSTSSANQLIGLNAATTWTITSVNGGKAGAFTFTNFSNLTGGFDVDVFKFSNGKYETGVIDGGGGGDWLDYSSYTTAITVNLANGTATGANSGIANIQNVRAGSGGSTMTGDAQGNILVGGAGVDTIVGGSGRSVLIGGKGNDSVTGGGDDDIVIGGYTNFDTNNAALASILAEWQRTDESYSQRVSNLKNGGGLNGTNKLVFGSTATVKDDGATNTLTGGAGMDWFFKGAHDTITDLQSGEQVN